MQRRDYITICRAIRRSRVKFTKPENNATSDELKAMKRMLDIIVDDLKDVLLEENTAFDPDKFDAEIRR